MLHHHVAYGHAEDKCEQPHCLTHQMFATNIVEQVFSIGYRIFFHGSLHYAKLCMVWRAVL